MFKQENDKNTYITLNDGRVFFLQQLGFFLKDKNMNTWTQLNLLWQTVIIPDTYFDKEFIAIKFRSSTTSAVILCAWKQNNS